MKLLLAVLFAFSLFDSSHAPAVFRTGIDTTTRSFIIETHRDWAPKSADRFYELVREHYYEIEALLILTVNDQRFTSYFI